MIQYIFDIDIVTTLKYLYLLRDNFFGDYEDDINFLR